MHKMCYTQHSFLHFLKEYSLDFRISMYGYPLFSFSYHLDFSTILISFVHSSQARSQGQGEGISFHPKGRFCSLTLTGLWLFVYNFICCKLFNCYSSFQAAYFFMCKFLRIHCYGYGCTCWELNCVWNCIEDHSKSQSNKKRLLLYGLRNRKFLYH